jgi:hypothetical protein
VNQTGTPQRTWRFPRLLAEGQLAFAALVWAGLIVVAAGITLGIAWFGEVTGSVWATASDAAPLFVAFIGGYVLHTMLPMYVANGRTRRDSAIEFIVFGAIYAAFAALLVTLGYVVERGFYAIGGWPRGIPDGHLFSSYDEVPLIFVENLVKLLVWVTAGALVGIAFYRYESNGALALLPATVVVALNGGVASGFMGFLERVVPALEISSAPLAAAVSILCTLAVLAMTWLIVRDLPLRNK